MSANTSRKCCDCAGEGTPTRVCGDDATCNDFCKPQWKQFTRPRCQDEDCDCPCPGKKALPQGYTWTWSGIQPKTTRIKVSHLDGPPVEEVFATITGGPYTITFCGLYDQTLIGDYNITPSAFFEKEVDGVVVDSVTSPIELRVANVGGPGAIGGLGCDELEDGNNITMHFELVGFSVPGGLPSWVAAPGHNGQIYFEATVEDGCCESGTASPVSFSEEEFAPNFEVIDGIIHALDGRPNEAAFESAGTITFTPACKDCAGEEFSHGNEPASVCAHVAWEGDLWFGEVDEFSNPVLEHAEGTLNMGNCGASGTVFTGGGRSANVSVYPWDSGDPNNPFCPGRWVNSSDGHQTWEMAITTPSGTIKLKKGSGGCPPAGDWNDQISNTNGSYANVTLTYSSECP